MNDLINRQDAINAFKPDHPVDWYTTMIVDVLENLPSAEPELPIKRKCTVCPHCSNCDVNDDGTVKTAEPEIEEKLYQYKYYITDNEGLQHEVIHIDDIRRVTGWVI